VLRAISKGINDRTGNIFKKHELIQHCNSLLITLQASMSLVGT